jgi:Lrp/AsnC family transcriptional regulator, leucine-responsive regulatory protein
MGNPLISLDSLELVTRVCISARAVLNSADCLRRIANPAIVKVWSRFSFEFLSHMAIDPIDYQLISLLQDHGRMSQIDLAAAVGLSQPAVAERIRKLEQQGIIIGFLAWIDARKLGMDVTAFIGVGIEHPKYNVRFAKEIRALPEVLECHHVTGADSYLLKVKTETTESLDRLISEKLRRIPGVKTTRTTIVMSSVKEDVRIRPSSLVESTDGSAAVRGRKNPLREQRRPRKTPA